MKDCLNSSNDWCFFVLVAGFCVGSFAAMLILFT